MVLELGRSWTPYVCFEQHFYSSHQTSSAPGDRLCNNFKRPQFQFGRLKQCSGRDIQQASLASFGTFWPIKGETFKRRVRHTKKDSQSLADLTITDFYTTVVFDNGIERSVIPLESQATRGIVFARDVAPSLLSH